MIRARLTQWVHEPPLTGGLAILCGIGLVALPTGLRAAVSGVVTGCEFTPYLPFVLLAAILLRWPLAGAVAIGAVSVMGGFFVYPLRDAACFASSAGIFLAGSAIIIGTIVLARRVMASIQSRGSDETSGGIVFSLEEGQVWASWYGQGPPLVLGSQRKVAAMMKDFLAQVELGKRLNRRR
jgi:hypothetical protein